MKCNKGTCYHGCACREATWAEKLAATEERVRRLERRHIDAEERAGKLEITNGTLAVRIGTLEDALRPFAEYWRLRLTMRGTPTSGNVYAVSTSHGEASLVAEDFAAARAALAPPPEAEKPRAMTRDEADAVEEIESAMFNAPPGAEKKGGER